MRKILAAVLISSLLLTSCTASQLNLAQTIINDIVAFLPLISDLLANPGTKTQANIVIAWIDKTTSIANDILSDPTKAGYLKASSDFTANVLPNIPGLTPTEIQGLTNISNDIQQFIKNNPPQTTSFTAKILGVGGASLSKSDIQKISEMKVQIQGIKAKLEGYKIIASR